MTTIKEKYPDLYDIFKSKECVLIHYTKKSENLK